MNTHNRFSTAVGVGFKPVHLDAIHDDVDGGAVDFFEVHAENYMGAGGLTHVQLGRLRQNYALSIHGVGLSIGGATPPDVAHLKRLRELCDRYEPLWFSEHLAWSTHDDRFFNDLLPVHYDRDTLFRVSAHIQQTQDALGRILLLENPSHYLGFGPAEMSEPEFISELVRRTGCGVLLDINNLYVSAINLCLDPQCQLSSMPLAHVAEIHLAGHAERRLSDGSTLLLDDHGGPVANPVWALYEMALTLCGPLPTLIEWDNQLPAWATLRAEASAARQRLSSCTLSLAAGGVHRE